MGLLCSQNLNVHDMLGKSFAVYCSLISIFLLGVFGHGSDEHDGATAMLTGSSSECGSPTAGWFRQVTENPTKKIIESRSKWLKTTLDTLVLQEFFLSEMCTKHCKAIGPSQKR